MALLLAICALANGCTQEIRHEAPEYPARARQVRRGEPNGGVARTLAWPSTTHSPEPAPPDADLSFCGAPDGALARVASRLAKREASGEGEPDATELAFLLRAEGEPHVWPHAWTLTARAPDPEDVAARLRRFLGSFSEGGERRCGIARAAAPNGAVTLAVVAVDALADLSPIPARARAGTWIQFEARMLVPTGGAKLFVLGPSGPPRTVVTTPLGGRIRATFAVDREGPWSVQLLAVTGNGPRPVLEATVFVDVEPQDEPAASPAPGEMDGEGDDARALFDMVNRARDSERLPSLVRSADLDRVAEAHARAMRDQRTLAHDAGDGSLFTRLAREGIEMSRPGENVAHALSARRAHRILWASLSHRGNLLDPRFAAIGVAVAPAPDGSVWVCEVFGDFGRPAERSGGKSRP